jgi:Fibronectin type III domain
MTEPQLDTQGEAREALNSAVADFGPRILSDPRMLRSRMSDVLPDLPRERYLLVTAAEADVAGELTAHVQGQHLDPETAIAMVSRSLSDRTSIEMASSTWVTTEYAQALGYRARSGAPLAPPSPAQSGPAAQPSDPNYAPAGSPALQAVSPPVPATAGPAGYQGYSPPQAPAAGGVYAAPPPPARGAPPQEPGPGHAAPTRAIPTAVPPQEPPPWTQPPPPSSPSRTRNRWPIFAAAAVVVVGLVAGLLVWAPWHKAPVTPTAVRGQSPTATSVLVSWAPSKGGATIDHYLILRDGTQVGSVPASQTSYLDHGLAPGTTHRYTIIAESGTQRSQPSAAVAVRTITPSPVGLAVAQTTWTSVAFHWSAPPNSPAPSAYDVIIDGQEAATVTGGTTSYQNSDLQLGTTYTYQVIAVWGHQQSRRSPVLSAMTLAAPLNGGWPLRFTTLSIPAGSTGLKVGQTWPDSWTFTPSCTATQCTLTTDAAFGPPGLNREPFTVNLTGSDGAYSGSTKADLTTCASVNVKDTVTVRIAAKNGAVSNGAWQSWGGTMDISQPYVTAGNQFCSPSAWTFALSATAQ